MKKTLQYFLLSIILLGGVNCSCDSSDKSEFAPVSISFVADYAGGTQTLPWKNGDRIGVFEKHSTKDWSSIVSAPSVFNTPYQTIGNKVFTAVKQPLTYPKGGEGVDFVAYAPYNDTLKSFKMLVNVAQQDELVKHNLLYANNLKERTRVEQPILRFKYALANIRFKFVSADGKDISNIKANLYQMPTQGVWDLRTGKITSYGQERGNLPITIQEGRLERDASVWIIPGRNITLTLQLILGKKDTIYTTVVQNTSFNSSNQYEYPLSITGAKGSTTVSPVLSKGYVEVPEITNEQLKNKSNHYITHHFTYNGRQVRNYEMLYNTDLKMAYWVAYPLCNFYTHKGTSRTNEWAYDPSLPRDQQANMLGGIRGYDRGHQIPSADRLVNREANEQTFYFTNMTPQLGALNQKVWAKLEEKVRSWASTMDTLYVVTGAVPPSDGKTARDGSGRSVAVPSYYYKALCRVNKSTHVATTIAFLFKHQYYRDSEPFMTHVLSVAELEQRLGITFFPQIETKYKTIYDEKLWK